MSSIINIGSVQSTLPVSLSGGSLPSSASSLSASHGGDVVELSAFGKALADAAELSSLRVARIRAFRTAIAEGTFETPERINGTADRLIKHVL